MLTGGLQRFHLFKFTNPGLNVTRIEFAQCQGRAMFAVVKDVNNLGKREFMTIHRANGLDIGVLTGLTGDNYIFVEAFVDALNSNVSYTIKVDFSNEKQQLLQKPLYFPSQSGRLSYEYVRDIKGTVRLTWPPLASTTTNVTGVRYKLVFSESGDAVMDSVCAIKSG